MLICGCRVLPAHSTGKDGATFGAASPRLDALWRNCELCAVTVREHGAERGPSAHTGKPLDRLVAASWSDTVKASRIRIRASSNPQAKEVSIESCEGATRAGVRAVVRIEPEQAVDGC